MNIIPAISITADALDAEKTRLEIIGENIANAQTTRGANGLPYARKIVSFESQLAHLATSEGLKPVSTLRVTGITTDPTPGQLVYNPAHPHADAEGMVRMPNVNPAREMVDLITASRAYEANLSVVRTARQMVQRALQIGR